MLPRSTAFQFFQMVARRKAQIFHNNRCIKRCEHRLCTLHQITREAFAVSAADGIGGKFALGALNHISKFITE